jgi:hypothetical protein
VKHVAVFTDSNHHDHPASACFDYFQRSYDRLPKAISVEKSKLMLCNYCNWVEWVDGNSNVTVKRWDSLLKYLLEEEVDESNS